MIPRSIYEALPFLYLVVGTVALFGASPIYGKLSAVLLIANAVVIYKMRKAYRSDISLVK